MEELDSHGAGVRENLYWWISDNVYGHVSVFMKIGQKYQTYEHL
jgi:hypothetical protein